MRFREVFRYEFQHRLRSGSTWLYVAFLFGLAFFMINVQAGETDPVLRNSPQNIFQTGVLFCGLFGILVSAGLFADAAIRDVAVGMDPLLFTTRLHKAEYLGGRFAAALAINAAIVLVIPIAIALAATMPYLDPDVFGPNRLGAYVQPVLLFLWPNLVLVGAFLFTIAALARQTIPVYLGAIAVFIGYIVAANYWTEIDSPMLSALADPLGVNALQAMTRYWTVAERNTRLVGFPAMLLWNRALWLAIGLMIFVLLYRTFRFVHSEGTGRVRLGRRRFVDAPAPNEAEGPAAKAVGGPDRRRSREVPRVTGIFDWRTRVRQTLAVARQAFVEVVSGRAFQVALVGAIGLVLLWGWNVGHTVFDTPTWPVTHLVLREVLSQRSILIPWLVIALYAGELVWKHRETGSAEIVDAAPVPTGIALLGRFLSLAAIVAAFHAAFMAGGMLLQALQGYYTFEPDLYVRVLFGLNLADHLLLAALAMTIHVLVNQKYVGHILVLLASAFRLLAPQLGLHRMLVYDSDPGWRYSEMNGFGPFVEPFVWFKLYWAAWALLFGVVMALFWVRGPELGVRYRLSRWRGRLGAATLKMAGVAIALILLLGGFVFYNTNVLNEFRGPAEAGLPKAEYERRYGKFEDLPQPTIVAADLRVEVYPEEPAADMRGSYRLVNQTAGPIDSVHVVIDRSVEARSISLDAAANPVVVDEETGYRIFDLEQPLAPGDSLRLSFDVAFRPRGFPNSGIQTMVVDNGSYFDRRLLPSVGYQPALELTGPPREQFGLVPRPSMPEPDDPEARRHDTVVRNEDRVQYDVTVGTAADQIAVVSAPLRRSWTENGRAYFHYGTDVPVPFGASVFSAKYAVQEDRWGDIALQVLYHPPHRSKVERMIESMKAALDYYTREFGPYQFPILRVVEIPPYSINGRAMVTTVAFAEQNFITRDIPGQVDHTFFGTAHEVAHSWWGGQLRGAFARGQAVVSETLSNYSAMMLTEKLLGAEQARRVYDYQMNRYLWRRAEIGRDVPLVDVENHPHIAYGKGAVAMYMLREQIGDNAVNTALRRMLERHRGGKPPFATSRDLVAELRAVTPEPLQYLLTDFFETVTLWDVKAERALVEPAGDGGYRVALDVVARKLRADSVGLETETPMDDLVEIGLFAADGADGSPLYLQRHRIHSGRQTITITVPRVPARAGIDPYRKLIDRESGNNVVEVKPAEAGAAGDRS